jgi:hypothetical protein
MPKVRQMTPKRLDTGSTILKTLPLMTPDPNGPNTGEAEASKVPPPTSPVRRRFRRFFLSIWLPLVGLFFGYLLFSYRASGFDRRILLTDTQIAVSNHSDSITFMPMQTTRTVSLIFIPGALVDPIAYAPLARSIALEGYPVIIRRLPFRTASTDAQADAVTSSIRRIIAQDASDTRWVVAGHSKGAVLACRFARDAPELLAGLALIGSSHPRDSSLSHLQSKVTKIFGSNDGLASPAEISANKGKLPPHTRWIEIQGGNHSQFGYYGFQLGDRRAGIDRETQQKQTSQALLELLGSV